MHVDAAVDAAVGILGAQRIHQLLARLDPAGALRQQQQDVELAPGQLATLAADAHLARAPVDGQPLEAQGLGGIGLRARRVRRRMAPRRASTSRGLNGFGR